MPSATESLASVRSERYSESPLRIVFFASLAIALLSVLLYSSSADAGKVYRWKSSDGTIHYGEHPPQGVNATEMSTTTGKPSKRSSGRERVEPGEYTGEEEQQAQSEPTAGEPATPKPKKDKGVCERARYNLKVLDERARIRQTDENGEERYLTDEEKEGQKEKAREAIKTYC